jgi:hypothetical protein
MPTNDGIRFDDLQRVENARGERVKPSKHHFVDAGERDAFRGTGRKTFNWCRSTRTSASNDARDRNSPATAQQISLQRSPIAAEHQPIRDGFLDG